MLVEPNWLVKGFRGLPYEERLRHSLNRRRLRGDLIAAYKMFTGGPQPLLSSAFAALYNTLIRPHLEYARQACSPNIFTDADCLEHIHRLATRLVKSFRRLPYEEQLRRLGRRRRLRGDLIVIYKIFSGGQCGQA